ncbi:hypothetical protein GCM10027185_62880 [Spirosoma pulveris]
MQQPRTIGEIGSPQAGPAGSITNGAATDNGPFLKSQPIHLMAADITSVIGSINPITGAKLTTESELVN